MAADGSRGPKPYTQRSASTLFLRIPSAEFGAVTRGRKREFRMSGRTAQLDRVETPTPVVGYKATLRGHDHRLMVLESTWQEPLGAISPESLIAELQPDLAHFRRYWISRTRKHFAPTRMVVVYRVRPWEDGDDEMFGRKIFEHLYGEFV